MIRRMVWTCLCAAMALALAATDAAALVQDLNVVQFPERKDVSLSFQRQTGAPAATIEATVEYRDGQAEIGLEYKKMKPAILFGGDVTCYVLWAVTLDEQVENLVELVTPYDSYEMEFSTGKKAFALMITAEPYYLVSKPSELVMFTSKASENKRAPSTLLAFSAFAPAAAHAMKSIEAIAWDSTTPLVLLQARKAHEIATGREVKKYAPMIFQEAGEVLQQANDRAERSPKSRTVLDLARRSVALSNSAMNIASSRIEASEIEKRVAKRREEVAALEQRAEQAETAARQARTLADEIRSELDHLRADQKRLTLETATLSNQKVEMETRMARLREEMATLEMSQRDLQKEKVELAARLQGALSHVAETKSTARGFVVSLPDILFDVNEATLKPDAKLVLSKLSGILLLMPDLGATIEGHTDSTGSSEYNQRLSERRAESVLKFLESQEVATDRLASVGYGMTQPIAENETTEGRRKNRRVEIVIREDQG